MAGQNRSMIELSNGIIFAARTERQCESERRKRYLSSAWAVGCLYPPAVVAPRFLIQVSVSDIPARARSVAQLWAETGPVISLLATPSHLPCDLWSS
jgi:hypothetical protein